MIQALGFFAKTKPKLTSEEKYADCPDIKTKLDKFLASQETATWSDLLYIHTEIVKDYRKFLDKGEHNG